MPNEPLLSRRGLLMKLGIAFNGLVAAALGVPIARFLLSSVTRGSGNAYLDWVPLGKISDFPEGELRSSTAAVYSESADDSFFWSAGKEQEADGEAVRRHFSLAVSAALMPTAHRCGILPIRLILVSFKLSTESARVCFAE